MLMEGLSSSSSPSENTPHSLILMGFSEIVTNGEIELVVRHDRFISSAWTVLAKTTSESSSSSNEVGAGLIDGLSSSSSPSENTPHSLILTGFSVETSQFITDDIQTSVSYGEIKLVVRHDWFISSAWTVLIRTISESSSSSDEEVGAGSQRSSKKGKIKKQADKKTIGKRRLVPEDPMWPTDVPPTFSSCEKDWSKEGILRAVVFQGSTELCWAFALTSSVEASLNIKAKREGRNLIPNLSPQHLANNVRTRRTGSMAKFANVENFLVNQGLVPENICEFTGTVLENGCHHAVTEDTVTKIRGLQRIKTRDIKESDIIKLVAERPVVIEILAHESFLHFQGDGIYYGPKRKDPSVGLHALLLIGYGTTEDGTHYWLVQNSYGTGWGHGGYGKIVRKCSLPNNTPSLIHKVRYPEV